MPLITPLLWQGQPFRHPEAKLDFLGMHTHWHTILAGLIPNSLVPIYNFDDLDHMLDVHQTVHELLAQGFGLSTPSDLSTYDLSQRTGWVLFMQIHSLEHERLRVAAGV